MIPRLLASLIVLALLTTRLAAQPVTVMVLPVDGSAEPALRTKLTGLLETAVAELGTVQAGTTTLGETAVAIGCDPATAACAESVRATLSVEILIYGNATVRDGQIELVVSKVEKDKPAVTTTQTIATTGEPQLDDGAMRPITGKPAPVVTCAAGVQPRPDGSCPAALPKPRARPNRVIGISLLVGAGLLMIGGLSQWNEKAKKQDQIDAAPTQTLADFQRLDALEDEAAKKATSGNLLMIAALGATAAGLWLLRKDHKAQRDTVKLTPSVTPTSAGVVLTIGAFR